MRAGPVPRLHCRSGPSAVGGLVVTVSVDSFDARLCGWSAPHILEEFNETSPPLGADFDASTAVARVASGFWVGTPLDHADPYVVLWCTRPVTCVAVPLEGFSTHDPVITWLSR